MDNYDDYDEVYYEAFGTKEKVYIEDAEDYAMDKLGIQIIPKGEKGELTEEQAKFIEEFTDWYFSGNWILQKKRREIYADAFDEMMDRIYMENLEKRLLGED